MFLKRYEDRSSGAKVFLLLLTETGLRIGEVYSISTDKIDFKNRVIK
ncbi:tyrosine-type recombinase/integrase [Sulfodiicoccus acidiphilus]